MLAHSVSTGSYFGRKLGEVGAFVESGFADFGACGVCAGRFSLVLGGVSSLGLRFAFITD